MYKWNPISEGYVNRMCLYVCIWFSFHLKCCSCPYFSLTIRERLGLDEVDLQGGIGDGLVSKVDQKIMEVFLIFVEGSIWIKLQVIERQ